MQCSTRHCRTYQRFIYLTFKIITGMKKLLYSLLFLVSFSGMAQTQYETGMRKAFALWEAEKPFEAANLFERIAAAEPDNWLPLFYAAQINIIYSFEEKDAAKLTAQLNKALDYMNRAKTISQENPDIMVLEAQWHTAWIVFDGQQYGMKYSAKVADLYEKALQKDPDHPIVILGKAEWDIGTARYFGQSVAPYCKDLERAIELFATFKPASEFHPHFGENRARSVLQENCK